MSAAPYIVCGRDVRKLARGQDLQGSLARELLAQVAMLSGGHEINIALRQALIRYGRHEVGCDNGPPNGVDCTCGLRGVSARLCGV